MVGGTGAVKHRALRPPAGRARRARRRGTAPACAPTPRADARESPRQCARARARYPQRTGCASRRPCERRAYRVRVACAPRAQAPDGAGTQLSLGATAHSAAPPPPAPRAPGTRVAARLPVRARRRAHRPRSPRYDRRMIRQRLARATVVQRPACRGARPAPAGESSPARLLGRVWRRSERHHRGARSDRLAQRGRLSRARRSSSLEVSASPGLASTSVRDQPAGRPPRLLTDARYTF